MEKILVVDDEIGILELCERVLEKKYQVTTSSSAENALKILTETTYDLVISDLKMPGMDGLELLRRTKNLHPDTEVMIFTGQGTIETAVETLKNGAYDYILKPFNISDLATSVDKCIEHSSLRRHENIFKETIYLYQLAEGITGKQSENELLNFILKRSVKALNADGGSIFIIHPDKDVLIPVARAGEQNSANDGENMKIGERVAGWVAKNNQALLIQNGFKNTPQFEDMPKRKEIASSMVAPLSNNETLLGIICLNRFVSQTNYLFTEHDLELFKLFCIHASLILAGLRNKQTLQEMNDLKSNFVANVSHELKTPLMAISGASELLMDLVTEEKSKTFLELIERNANRMKLLVNDLLDFSRMDTKRMKLNFIEFNFKELVADTLEDFKKKAEEKKIKLYADAVPEAVITADQEKLKQVISNFVQNAMKFTPDKGAIRIKYGIEKDELFFSVSDTGIGISKAEQSKVFEKFYQVDGSASREQAGFGLGLAIVKSIISAHNGSVWVESEEGKGTEFFVRIPIKQETNK